MVLLVPAVQADRPHVVGLAEPLRLALGELGATQPPADEEVLSLKHTALVFSIHTFFLERKTKSHSTNPQNNFI